MPPDEPRYAAVSREMFEAGRYLVPTLNGEAYKEKPPLLFWASGLLAHLFGDVNTWAARIPSAAAATVIVLLTASLARQLFGVRVAWLAGLVLLTTARFWWEARVGQLDMLLTMFVTLGIYALWQWEQSRRTGYLFLLYGALAGGMLTKGFPALIFPLLLIVAFYWGRPEDRRGLRLGWGMLAVLAVFLLWAIPSRLMASGLETVSGSETSAQQEILKQTIGRFLLGVSKAEWPWFYVQNLVKDLVPWTLLLPVALPIAWRARKESPAMRFLWAWILPAFVFFSISVAKRETYILPLYPPFAILMAYGLEVAMERMANPTRARFLLFWGVALIVGAFAPWFLIDAPWQTLGVPAALAWCGVVVACGLDSLRRAASGKNCDLSQIIAAHTMLVLLLGTVCLLPAMNPKYSVREFCAPIASAAQRGEDFDLYSLALFREELLYHGRHQQQVVLMEVLDLGHESSLAELKAQADLRSRLRKWMGQVTLSDAAEAAADNQRKLEEALQGFIAAYPDRAEAEMLLRALRAELDKFQTSFSAARPALCFVEERDWRWLRAVEPDLAAWRVLRERRMSSNTLLLLGNSGGAALL